MVVRMRTRHSRLLLTALLLVALLPGVGQAVPDELTGQLDDAEAQLAQLDARVSMAVEEYNEAAAQLARLQDQHLQTADVVASLTTEVDELEDRTAAFVRSLYIRGPVSELSRALHTGEVTEAGRDLAVMDRLSRQRQEELARLGQRRAALDDARSRLAAQVEAAAERQQELDDHRATVEQMVAEQRDEVVALQDRIAQIEAEEAAEQARREREAAEAAQAQAQADAEEAAQAAQAQAQAAADAATSPTPAPAAPTSSSPTSVSPSPPSPPPSSPSPEPPPPSPEPPPEPAPGTRAGADAAVQAALSQLGKPYVYAAEGPDSYDCSGLTLWAWRHAGVSLPHSSRMQFDVTTRVTRDELQPGDLVFYGSPIHHVAMYVEGTSVVEAPYTGANVRIREDGLLRDDIVGYGRP